MDKNIVTEIGIKVFSVVLFVLLLTTAYAAATTTVSIANDATVGLGDTVTIPIMVNDITNYGSGTIKIWYDHQVVHVTGVTGSPESQVAAKYIDNSIGYAAISASNLYGASGDIAFANVEFTAVGFGSSPLDLTVDSLYDTTPADIPRSISDGSVKVTQPPKSFLIYGYVAYENGTLCNNPTVNITNLNNGKRWTAGMDNTCYQVPLTSGVDLNVSEILRFDVTDGAYSGTTDHTVSADEVDDGGLFEFNLTLPESILGDVNGDGHITTADATIVLQMAVRGEYSEVADVNGDDAVTSLDALMILQAVDPEGRWWVGGEY